MAEEKLIHRADTAKRSIPDDHHDLAIEAAHHASCKRLLDGAATVAAGGIRRRDGTHLLPKRTVEHDHVSDLNPRADLFARHPKIDEELVDVAV